MPNGSLKGKQKMSKRVALLVGVTTYGEGIPALTAPAQDVAAMERVLANPDLGGFEVTTLVDPDAQSLRIALFELFQDLAKDDFVLFFFSGHGLIDDRDHLFLATKDTAKKGFVATAVQASYIQGLSQDSHVKHQVMILDCCYSGAFKEGWQAKSVGVELRRELGLDRQGEAGRAVLTSSSATQTSFQQEGADLSLYTQYLVEGIETGIADRDQNGEVSIQELHEYAKGKVQGAKPSQKPEIILDREGYNLVISRAIQQDQDSKLKFRRLVEEYITGTLGVEEYLKTQGKFSRLGQLNLLRQGSRIVGLAEPEAQAVIETIQKPYQTHLQRVVEHKKLYEEAFQDALEDEYPLSEMARQELAVYRQELDLDAEAVADIEARLEGQMPTPPAHGWDDAVPLESEKGVDYTRLRQLLKAGQWQEADQETGTCMEQALGTDDWGEIYHQKLLLSFPCADLKTIDRLWVQASQGRYGFSVQKEIYVNCGAKLDGNYPGDTIWREFGERVGWRVEGSWLSYSSLNFSGTGVPGHLPFVGVGWSWLGRARGWVQSESVGLFSRIETCKV